MYRGILARFQNFSVCVLVFVFVFLYLYVLHPGAVPQWSLYPGLSKNIAHVWSIVSFYCEFCFRILALSSHSVVRPSVDKRDMSIYANIYTDFEHWFQYISCSHDQTRPDGRSSLKFFCIYTGLNAQKLKVVWVWIGYGLDLWRHLCYWAPAVQ